MNIRPIRTEKDHAAALRRIEALWSAAPGSAREQELDVLATLAEAYEEKRWPIAAPHPIEALKLWMETHGYSQADLAEVIGSRSRASEVLNCRRYLTVDMIWALTRKWRIPSDCLIRPYRLKVPRSKRGRTRSAKAA